MRHIPTESGAPTRVRTGGCAAGPGARSRCGSRRGRHVGRRRRRRRRRGDVTRCNFPHSRLRRRLLMAADPTGGYWTANPAGAVTPHGSASSFGSPALSGLQLSRPIVGMAATPDGRGYWLVASDGGIFNYGDATFYGSTGAIHLNKPIVGMAATPDGQRLLARRLRRRHLQLRRRHVLRLHRRHPPQQAHRRHGRHPRRQRLLARRLRRRHLQLRRRRLLRLDRRHPPQPADRRHGARRPTAPGYWLVAFDGGVFTFGDAGYYGSTAWQGRVRPRAHRRPARPRLRA